MIQPGVYNITLQRRADYSVLLEFKDSEEDPINLTGWTVAAQVWNSTRTIKYDDFDVEYVSRPDGRVRISLPFTSTTELPNEASYDVLLINPNGLREYYLEGTVQVSEGYTVQP